MKSIILYHSSFDHFGGVETFCIAFCKRLSPFYDITFVSNSLRHPNIFKIAEYCNVMTLREDVSLSCDVLVFATAWGKQPSNIKASKVIQMVHADYAAYIKGWNFKYKKHQQTTHHVCVGKNVAKQFEITTGFKCDKIIYNLLPSLKKNPKQDNEILTLISATRFSKEKGIERMLKLSQLIPLPYKWIMYGSVNSDYAKRLVSKFPKQVEFKGYSHNVLPEIAKADYLVQLSDTEGMPYALLESLSQLTPVITTDYPAAKELITDGVNGYILDMELTNYEKIFANQIKLTNFEELSNENDWRKFIG